MSTVCHPSLCPGVFYPTGQRKDWRIPCLLFGLLTFRRWHSIHPIPLSPYLSFALFGLSSRLNSKVHWIGKIRGFCVSRLKNKKQKFMWNLTHVTSLYTLFSACFHLFLFSFIYLKFASVFYRASARFCFLMFYKKFYNKLFYLILFEYY